MIKNFTVSMILLIMFTMALPGYTLADGTIPKTNIDQTLIYPYEDREGAEFYIQYGGSGKESIGKTFVGLFINGSIIKNANIITENNRTLLPIRIVSEQLGAQIEWDAKTQKVTITDANAKRKIELFIDHKNAKMNGKTFKMDAAPQIIHHYTYVPLRFVAEALHAKVAYFNGRDLAQPHILPRLPHVMISRYPSDVKMLSKEAAIAKLKQELIIAYEKKFGKFIPPGKSEKPGQDDDQAILRDVITHLKIVSENDRYYVVPVMYDFWIDKYTGDIYTFYNGLTMSIQSFDPYADQALSFPG